MVPWDCDRRYQSSCGTLTAVAWVLLPGSHRSGQNRNKRPVPVLFAGTGLNISLRCHPAWRVTAPPHAYHHTPAFVYGEPSPSHILGSAFLFALGSPFPSGLPAALPPPAALCEDKPGKYSLFFNGLADHIILFPLPQPSGLYFHCFSRAVFPVLNTCPSAPSSVLRRRDSRGSSPEAFRTENPRTVRRTARCVPVRRRAPCICLIPPIPERARPLQCSPGISRPVSSGIPRSIRRRR